MDLTKRQIQLILILVENKKESDHQALSAKDLSQRINVSTKTIYKDLQVIGVYVKNYDVELVKKPRIGIYIKGSDKKLLKILTEIEFNKKNRYLDRSTRRELVFSQLLNTDVYITTQYLSDKYFVNRQIILDDIDNIELRLESIGVSLIRKSGKGFKLNLNEEQRRKILTKVISRQLFNSSSIINEHELKIVSDNNLSIPKSLITKVDKVLSNFIINEHMVLNDYEYQSLFVHLLIAVERIKLGKFIDRVYWGKSETFLKEAEVLVRSIEDELSIKFPSQEIYYVQLHLLAAGKKHASKVKANLNANNLLLEYLKKIGFDNQLYEGLLLHINSSLNRWKLGVSITNPYKDEIIRKYNYAFENAIHLKELYENKYNITINDDETAYLALHFEAFLERKRAKNGIVNTIIVCSTGLGTSQLLAARLKREFSNLKIIRILSYDEYLDFDIEDVDLIVSTIELSAPTKPVVYASPVVSTDELKNKINIAIENNDIDANNNDNLFNSLISDKNILISKASSWEDAITKMGILLEKNQILKPNSIKSAIAREHLSYTSFKNIATPHANPKYVKQSQIGVLKLLNPITWGKQKVSLVFFIAFNQNTPQSELDKIYDRFWDILSNRKIIKEIISSKTKEQIINLLKGK
ncbi:transcription antiterminator [Lactobacillus halodurans]|uniref:Transcription antiterminator n=1 Tax=Companilactobacillus halodurans TaxID=2584183 RepID=A0A5P0ZQA3_9LACO|nr:BglG family transcription antiterminator [Companilactobacillus halodurans]MQS76433.1 transcription antiterminator [Companilactobacillus halodurans]